LGRTKVVGIAGKFGARYGATLRKKYKEVMEKRYAPHTCPHCGFTGYVWRAGTAIWKCDKCGAVWAGGAYVPRTGLSKTFPKLFVK